MFEAYSEEAILKLLYDHNSSASWLRSHHEYEVYFFDPEHNTRYKKKLHYENENDGEQYYKTSFILKRDTQIRFQRYDFQTWGPSDCYLLSRSLVIGKFCEILMF